MRKPTKAIITDAGYASRYLPIAKTIPKGMLPIGNIPIMQLVVEECVAADIKEIIIVSTAEGKPIYEDYFNNAVNHVRKQLRGQGKEDRYDAVRHVLDFPKIRVIVQDPALPYGNGSPIVSARDYIADDEAFLALYSDDIVFGTSDAKSMVAAFEKNPDAKGVIMAQEVEASVVDKYGIISLKNGDKLDNIVEKPKVGKAPSTLASYGRYLLTPEVFDYLLPKHTGLDDELWTVDAITRMAATGAVMVVKTEGEWMTTGDPKNYFLAHLKYVMDHEEYADAVRQAIV
ncbi:MAG TPA: sugar phosphate nucleotidyltransferase [Candidatus Saccharibacteria bacterium]|jgi:UTP--glucose-1-phosphate uridylyltransferase|nr:sugar phosphate nucleotidyltransferase [Candidatus Saccharibacteria bacterium]HMR38213.1 sugar phosphate nucleotidyltransferase [Candidatus Saccharibacteria bacterium]